MNPSKLQKYAQDPLAFVVDLAIPSTVGPCRFGDIMADFQRRDFEAIVPALLALAAGRKPDIGRFWIERTKGASKDTDVAVCLLWLLVFAPQMLEIQVGAYDSAQASETRKIIRAILAIDAPLNRLCASVVDVQTSVIRSTRTGSECAILTTDAMGKHGSRPDVVLVNELSHIGNQEFAETLLDNADKVPFGLVIIATNAGFKPSWQANWRAIARDSDRWVFSVFGRPSPWILPESLEESRKRNSAKRYARLWWGQWVSGGGDALDPDWIESAIVGTVPMTGAEPGWTFTAGLDIGVRRDRTGFVVLACQAPNRPVRLAWAKSWTPRGADVDLDVVEREVIAAWRKFNLRRVGYDPSQMLHMSQRLRRVGVPMFEQPFVGSHLDRMASALLQAFSCGDIELYRSPLDDSAELIEDLGKLTIVDRGIRGYKLESVRDQSGHADLGVAMSICLVYAKKLASFSRTGVDVAPRIVPLARPEPHADRLKRPRERERHRQQRYVPTHRRFSTFH